LRLPRKIPYLLTERGSIAANAAPDTPYDKSERVKSAKKNFPQSFMVIVLRHF